VALTVDLVTVVHGPRARLPCDVGGRAGRGADGERLRVASAHPGRQGPARRRLPARDAPARQRSPEFGRPRALRALRVHLLRLRPPSARSGAASHRAGEGRPAGSVLRGPARPSRPLGRAGAGPAMRARVHPACARAHLAPTVLTTNDTSTMVTTEVGVSAGNAGLRSLAPAVCAGLAVGLAVLVAATPAAARPAHVRAGGVVHPTRDWCPTNRTCFSRIAWIIYTSRRAVGHGRAKDCAGGGGPCRTSKQTVILDRPRHLCGRLEFSRLRMFGRVFHAGAAPLCAIYYESSGYSKRTRSHQTRMRQPLGIASSPASTLWTANQSVSCASFDIPINRTYRIDYTHIRTRRLSCHAAKRVLTAWVREPAPARRVAGYHCRYKRGGSDFGQLRCSSAGRLVSARLFKNLRTSPPPASASADATCRRVICHYRVSGPGGG